MATTGTSSENNVLFFSNFEGDFENEPFKINLKMTNNETNTNFSLLNWMDKKKNLLLGVLVVLALSVAINYAILKVVLNSFAKGKTFVHVQPRVEFSNQNQTSFVSSSSSSWSYCPAGWTAYTELKCIKVLYQMETHERAVELCREVDATATATLLNIQSHEEQLFMERLLFTELRLFNSVWLGGATEQQQQQQLSNTSDDQQQQQQQQWQYSNWAVGDDPSSGNGRACIQMLTEHHRKGAGKWASVRCQQRGAVVCQRRQNWSPDKLQEHLLQTTVKVQHQQKEIEEVKAKSSIAPAGFIYVQLPNQPAPVELWRHHTWEDISAQYANVFFRVIGDKTGVFGQVQNETSPRLSSVTMNDDQHKQIGTYEVTPGKMGDGIPVRNPYFHEEHETKTMYLHVNEAEVRPENMAIKVWKRVP